MHYYTFHIGDYCADTARLTMLEDCAYRRLMDAYYRDEAPIQDSKKYFIVGARTQDEKEAVDTVLAAFFELSDGVWFHARCERELEKTRQKSKGAAESAQRRWEIERAKREHSESRATVELEVCESDANALRTHCESDAKAMLPNTQYPIPNKPPIVPQGGWALFKAAYPKRSGSLNLKEAETKFNRLVSSGTDPTAIISGAEKYRAWAVATGKDGTELVAQMTTWLNGKRWEEDYEIPHNGRKLSADAERKALYDNLGVTT